MEISKKEHDELLESYTDAIIEQCRKIAIRHYKKEIEEINPQCSTTPRSPLY